MGRSSVGIVIIVAVIVGIGSYWALTGSEGGYRGPTESYTSERFGFSFKYPTKYQIKAKNWEDHPWNENWLASIEVHDNLPGTHRLVKVDVCKKKGRLKGRSLREVRDFYIGFAENNENITFVEGPKIVRGGKGLLLTVRVKVPPRWRKEVENSKYMMSKELLLVEDNLAIEVSSGGWGENRYENLKGEINLVFESFSLEG